MGTDIHTYVEVYRPDKNEWRYHKHGHPFSTRNYGLFGFLADVSNYSKVPPLSKAKYALPDNLSKHVKCEYQSERDYGQSHSYSWFTLKELLDFDYEQTFDDRRYNDSHNGAAELPPDKHNIVTYREFLGELYFDELEHLKLLGHGNPEHVRIIFWFDN